MAEINCTRCYREYSDENEVCPHCGYNEKTGSNLSIYLKEWEKRIATSSERINDHFIFIIFDRIAFALVPFMTASLANYRVTGSLYYGLVPLALSFAISLFLFIKMFNLKNKYAKDEHFDIFVNWYPYIGARVAGILLGVSVGVLFDGVYRVNMMQMTISILVMILPSIYLYQYYSKIKSLKKALLDKLLK